MNPLALALVQFVVVLGLAPLAVGLPRFIKARFQGRRGAAPWLPYWEFATLLRKENLVSSTASWVFRVAPFIVLATALFLALTLPLTGLGHFSSELANFIVIAAVLATGSVFLVLGALDSGGAISGLGASRAMTLAALLEPTVILTFAALAVITGTSNIDEMMAFLANSHPLFPLIAVPTLLLPILALTLIALAENARYPVDSPTSSLELATVQRAMVSQYSGPYLAMLEYAAAVKLTVFALLITNFILPLPLLGGEMSLAKALLAITLVVLASLLKLFVAMFGLSLLESTIAKMRFYRVQEYLTATFFMALAGLVLAILVDLS